MIKKRNCRIVNRNGTFNLRHFARPSWFSWGHSITDSAPQYVGAVHVELCCGGKAQNGRRPLFLGPTSDDRRAVGLARPPADPGRPDGECNARFWMCAETQLQPVQGKIMAGAERAPIASSPYAAAQDKAAPPLRQQNSSNSSTGTSPGISLNLGKNLMQQPRGMTPSTRPCSCRLSAHVQRRRLSVWRMCKKHDCSRKLSRSERPL